MVSFEWLNFSTESYGRIIILCEDERCEDSIAKAKVIRAAASPPTVPWRSGKFAR